MRQAYTSRLPDPAACASFVLGRVLELDADSLAAFRSLAGRSVRIELRNPDVRFSLEFTAEGPRVVPAGAADVTIRGSTGDFLSYAMKRGHAPGGGIEIAGDVGLARELQDILARLDPDFEELLSRWMGDTAARKAGNALRAFAAWGRDAVRSLFLDTGEYLRFEQRLVVEKEEVEAFSASVHALRDDVERLRARLQRLEGRR